MNTPQSTMRPQSSSHRRRAGWIAACTAALLTAAVLTAPAALAADGPYNIDGNVPDPNSTELSDAFGSVKELGPLNSNTTKIGVIHTDGLPTLGMTNPNAQVDLRRAWLDTERDTASPNHDWLYFAWERDNNSGSGFIAYEFMQNPVPAGCAYATATEQQLIDNCNPWANRKAGDFMILWDQQGGSKDLYLRTWSGTAPNLVLGAPTLLNAAVSQAAYSADGFRGEAAVDLTATIFGGSTACRSFANTIPSTVTGNSDTADYKDTILRTAPPISNCTSTTVTTPKLADGTTNIPAGGLDLGPNGVGVTDSATVSLTGGTATPAGTVSFFLCQVNAPDLCTSEDNPVGTPKALSGASYPATVVSDVVTVTQPGRYCFRAVYSGDALNGIPGSGDSSAGECFTVKAVQSTLTSAQSWVPNDSVTVSAAAGGALAGSVSFELFANGTCSGTAIYTAASVPVAGTSPQTVYSANTTAVTTSGTYSWKVAYDSTNAAQLDIAASCHETSSLTITNEPPAP